MLANIEILKCKATLIEEMLGTANADISVHEEYIASLAPDAPSREEEVAALGVEEVVNKSMTVFPRLPTGQPCMFDYQIKGFLKNAARVAARINGSVTKKTKAYIKILTDCVFVYAMDGGRKIPLCYEGAEEGKVGNLQRSLRAQTMQGDRNALANSETVPAGATFEFEIHLLEPSHKELVLELLQYSKYQGFLQWRGAGFGRANIEVA
jgi:hypothetical protein